MQWVQIDLPKHADRCKHGWKKIVSYDGYMESGDVFTGHYEL